MSDQEKNGIIDQLGRGIVGFLKFSIRLIFVLALAVALGAGIYFGISAGLPALDRLYIQPVRENTNDIVKLEARGTQMVEQYSTQIAGLQERITNLEIQSDTNKNSLDEVNTRLATLEPALSTQAALTAQVDDLAAMLTSLEDSLTETIGNQATALVELNETLEANQAAIASLRAEAAQQSFPVGEVFVELQLVKAMSLLTRSQVFVFQNNFGLAVEDIETAREILLALSITPEAQSIDLSPILARLDLASANILERPEQANNDLQVAWGLLVNALDVENSAGSATPMPGTPVEATGTPASTPTP